MKLKTRNIIPEMGGVWNVWKSDSTHPRVNEKRNEEKMKKAVTRENSNDPLHNIVIMVLWVVFLDFWRGFLEVENLAKNSAMEMLSIWN